jgi:hypothetical protein
MKEFLLKAVLFCAFSFLTRLTYAQDNVEEYVETGQNNAENVYKAYMEPLIVGFGYGVTNGWYNTAVTHEKFGIDLSISATAAYAPDDQLYFNVNDLNLQDGVTLSGASDGRYPTALGPTQPVPIIGFSDTSVTVQGPGGFEFANEVGIVENAAFVPMVQLAIGTFKNTDLKLRFASDFGTISDYKFLMWGVGLQHDINQWIPVIRRFPIDFSILVAYTNLTSEVENFDEDNPGNTLEFNSNNFTAQFIVSKKISFFTPYAAIGYNGVSSNIDVLGTYDVVEFPNDTQTITDPVNNLELNNSSFRATFGARLKFGFISIFSDYTFQEYDIWTLGVSLVNIKENDRLGL